MNEEKRPSGYRPSIIVLLDNMPDQWRARWCFAAEYGGCGCMGCANYSGGLIRNGYTYADWLKVYPDNLPEDQIRNSYEELMRRLENDSH